MTDLILILAVVVPTVGFGVWWLLRPVKARVVAEEPAGLDLPVILFRNGVLEHASEAILECLPIAIGAHSWEDLHDILVPRFPDFPLHAPARDAGGITVTGPAGSIRILPHKSAVSLTFHILDKGLSSQADAEELEVLRQVSARLPYPAWKTDRHGDVIWHNGAYAALRKRTSESQGSEAAPLFALPDTTKGAIPPKMKVKIGPADAPEWFSVTCSPVPDGAIYHATSLAPVIKAEEAQRDFVQTLAKTFAHLSIGLAIFNRDRQLALFNPALIDLTGLSVSFLSPRPTIDSFFDAMRENRRMPEPKNYKTWRHRMTDLISAAETGRFEETWSLESGQTYRVTGRPHPDGAIAFLIEDISAQISLTRNFRAELELGQSLVDTFEDALAVFSQSGVLTFSNKAYDLLWGFKGDSSFADVTIADAVRLWREKSAPNPMWQDLQEAVMTLGEREEWTMPVCLKGQKPMQCRIVPIASGATVVRFSHQVAPGKTIQTRSRKTTD